MGAPQYEQAGADIAGTGTLNTIPRWTGASTLGDSIITQPAATQISVSGNVISVGKAVAGLGGNFRSVNDSGTEKWLMGLLGSAGASAWTLYDLVNTQVRVAVDGTNGNVGIGTASPASPLQIGNGTYAGTSLTGGVQLRTSQPIYVATDGTRTAMLGTDGTSQAFAGTLTAHDFQLRAGNGTALTVQQSTLNVGIGTASPATRLHVDSSSSTFSAAIRGAGGTSFVAIGTTATGPSINGYTANFAGVTDLVLQPNGNNTLINPSTGNVGIGTTSPTAGRSLTTALDIDVYGVRVGRGAGAQSNNVAVGPSSLAANTTGQGNTAIGSFALNANVGGVRNTVLGEAAGASTLNASDLTYIGRASGYYQTGGQNTGLGQAALLGASGLSTATNNVALGYQAGIAITTGGSNVLIGHNAGNTLTTGASNIVIGAGASTAAATDARQLVLGSATNYVATNGGATTYYATAGALLGYIQVYLNGANVKIPVYAP